VGKSIEAMGLPPDQTALVQQVMAAALAGQTIDQAYVRRSPQGERSFRAIIAPVMLHHEPSHATAGQIVGVVGVDIETTEARRLEAELIQAAREESIGRAANGIAHDLNNLLTVMLGFSERAVLQIGQGDRDSALTSLQRVRDTTMRGSSFVRHLLAFARRDQPRIEVIDLHLILDGMQALLAMTLGDQIRIEVQPQAPTALVRADRARIEQVLLNLAVNSRDAITNDVVTHGGWFRISTAEQDYSVPQAAALGLPGSGRYLCVTVQDSGPGIPPELCARVFEPFFTTKPAGRGTGLGLSLCRRIVRDAGGDIAMLPGEGGAHIVIYLPLATLT
jgi:two-component system, cell cycle sensor histidine kinase and response regulator CckA